MKVTRVMGGGGGGGGSLGQPGKIIHIRIMRLL